MGALDRNTGTYKFKGPSAAASGLCCPCNRWTLSNTQVSDLAPLAGLSALRSLNLTHSRHVSDLAPLARLSGLHELRLNETQGSGLAPLAGLSALRDRAGPRQVPPGERPRVARRPLGSQGLNLDETAGARDLAPLAGLSALRSLTLRSTRVS